MLIGDAYPGCLLEHEADGNEDHYGNYSHRQYALYLGPRVVINREPGRGLPACRTPRSSG